MAYTDIREAFEAMLAGFNPEEAEGLDLVYQIDVTGEGGGSWHLIIKDGACRLAEGAFDSPSLSMEMSVETCLKWMNKEASGVKLFMAGEVKSQGNVMLAPKLEQLFTF